MNKRQIDKRISLITPNTVETNLIIDPEYLFLIKKTEKISIATYILTDFIPDTETIKKSIKDNIHQILNNVFDLWHSRTNRTNVITTIKSDYLKLNTQITLAQISGFISHMNSDVLKNEINIILKSIDELERELLDEKSGEIKQNFYSVDTRLKRTYSKENAEESDVLYKGHNKGQTTPSKLKPDKPRTPIKITMNTSPSSDSREEKVLSIIKENKSVSIKDISNQILDCSEKTIQRTLNKLISEGQVQKTGERRWARYFV